MKNTEIGNNTENINIKNKTLSTVLTATDQKQQIHKQVILVSITSTFRTFGRCDGGQYHLFNASLSISIANGALMVRTCRLDRLSVCVCVQKVYCGKTAEWIRMPLGMVSGVGRVMGVLDGSDEH